MSRALPRALGLTALLAAGLVAAADVVNPFFNDLGPAALVGVALAAVSRDRIARGLSLLAAAVWGVTALSPSGPVAAKVVVLGVDGATFDKIDNLDLPNFARLRKDGTRATLTSMEPMFSPLLWTTMASGRPPGEHGIRGFHVQSTDCKVARFWDIAEDQGYRIGLYKWLVDYPPREVEGFWVPSWLAPAAETWPPSLSYVKELELSHRLRRKQVESHRSTPELVVGLVGDGVRLSTLVRAAEWSLEERFLHPAPERANVAMQLLRGRVDRDVFIAQLHARAPTLATFTYYATDGLAHLYWDHPASVEAAYHQADEILGDIRGQLGPDARLIVVSDHGFKAMDGTGLAGQFAPLTERLQARFTAEVGPADISKVGHKLSVGLAHPEDTAKAVAWLGALTDASGAAFYAVEDLGGGSIGLTLADEQITAERLAKDTVGGEPIAAYVKLTDAYTGTHEPRGIFYAVGAGVPAGQELGPFALLDVAPTVLAALGIPASEEMTGTTRIFPEVTPRVADWDRVLLNLKWIGGTAGQDETMLKQLGYIDGQ
jgi:hypothetical protein